VVNALHSKSKFPTAMIGGKKLLLLSRITRLLKTGDFVAMDGGSCNIRLVRNGYLDLGS
jgi:hypothetical protein